jgi:hypothetical protein
VAESSNFTRSFDFEGRWNRTLDKYPAENAKNTPWIVRSHQLKCASSFRTRPKPHRDFAPRDGIRFDYCAPVSGPPLADAISARYP